MAVLSEVKRLEIKISDVIGEFAITPDDGQQIFDKIHLELREGHPILLDFTQVRVVASPFLNMAVGRLLEDVPSDNITRCLETRGLSNHNKYLLERVIANAREYYGNPIARCALDKAIANTAEDL